MNLYEKQMVDLLKKGKESYNYAGVKAEFEAEGTRIDELYRLLDIARKANVKVGLKIGGCEAIRDLMQAKQLGVDYIIAPMIETGYALSKYIAAKDKVYNIDEQEDVRFLFNLETKQSYQNLSDIIQVSAQGKVDGIVFGRVDFTSSLGLDRDDAISDEVTNSCVKVAEQCKVNNLDFVVGGAVAKESIAALEKMREQKLSRFETRKVIFHGEALDIDTVAAIDNAVKFELLWLKNKQEYYSSISQEDLARIDMLSKRVG